MSDGEFEGAVEDHAAAARVASVEAEHELVQIAGQVGVVDRSLVGAEQINQHWLIERHDYRTPIEAREHLRAQAAAAA